MKRLYLCGATALALTLSSCGNEEPKILEKFGYDIDQNKVGVSAEFSADIELNTEFNVPIMHYGSVSLMGATEGNGFTIMADVNLEAFTDDVTSFQIRELPTGVRMSRYVDMDVGALRIDEEPDYPVTAYLGPDLDHMYMGVAVQFPFLGSEFPYGFGLTQWIRDSKGRVLGVVTIFGPKADSAGNIIETGGIFVMTNVSDIISYVKEDREAAGTTLSIAALDGGLHAAAVTDVFSTGLIVNPLYAEEYGDNRKLFGLFKKFKKLGKKSGHID